MLGPFATDQSAVLGLLAVIAAAWFLAGPTSWRLACRRAGWLDRTAGVARRARGPSPPTRQERWTLLVHLTTSALVMLGCWLALLFILAP